MSNQFLKLYYGNRGDFLVHDTFIAANTYKGFFSYFDELIYGSENTEVYLIKGGPGCGKSTFMKSIAKAAAEKGCNVEQIFCSSDKDSLDGVVLRDTGKVIIDATPPHSFDMKYPGVNQNIIDFSQFWSKSELKADKTQIIELFNEISERYKTVYGLLKIAGYIQIKMSATLEQRTNIDKVTEYIKKLIKQNAIVSIESNPEIKNRMLSCFSGDGVITLSETTCKLCDEIIVFEDSADIAHILLNRLASILTKLGYDTLRIHNPLIPESRLEQVLVPQLRLGFVATKHIFSPDIQSEKIIKKINTKSFTDKEYYSQNKNKFAFLKKSEKEFIDRACNEIKQIKELHDRLESFYIKAMDYNKLNEFTTQFINKY